MRLWAGLSAAIATLAVSAAIAQPAQITPLSPPQPVENDGKIEVIEFSPTAASTAPTSNRASKVAAASCGREIQARALALPVRGIDSVPIFYSLEAMGQLERLHQNVRPIWKTCNSGHLPTLLKWLEKNGVKAADYESVKVFLPWTIASRALIA